MLDPLSYSNFIEVQEQATSYLYFLKWMKESSSNENANNTAEQAGTSDILSSMPAKPNASSMNNLAATHTLKLIWLEMCAAAAV